MPSIPRQSLSRNFTGSLAIQFALSEYVPFPSLGQTRLRRSVCPQTDFRALRSLFLAFVIPITCYFRLKLLSVKFPRERGARRPLLTKKSHELM